MENEIELLNQTEADLLMLMQQYQSGQYLHLADCIRRVRVVRETLRHLTPLALDAASASSAEHLSGLESVPAVEFDTHPRK